MQIGRVLQGKATCLWVPGKYYVLCCVPMEEEIQGKNMNWASEYQAPFACYLVKSKQHPKYVVTYMV